jgi:DNA-binding MarR family transcriptional regulator
MRAACRAQTAQNNRHLARGDGMKPQSMGTIIAALEEIGLVERKPHPADGRQMKIQLSAKDAKLT